MYVRFVTPLVHPESRVESGFFQAWYSCDRTSIPQWIEDELDSQTDWFNRYLPVPGELGRHFKRRRSKWGVCWFDPSFKEAIAHAHYCAWLLGECGLPVRMLKSSRPGKIIWRDAFQVVVQPAPDMPRAFH